MLKKILSLLLISILVISAIGNVTAKHYTYNIECTVGDNLKVLEMCYDLHVAADMVFINTFRDSGLFRLHQKAYDPYYATAIKAGAVNLTMHYSCYDFSFYDDDYVHFIVKPHDTKLVLSDNSSHDYNVIGKVNISATDPSKSHPTPIEFWNSNLSIDFINVDDESDTYHTDVNTGSNNSIDFSDLDLHLKPNSIYNFSVYLHAKGNWSDSILYDYLKTEAIPTPVTPIIIPDKSVITNDVVNDSVPVVNNTTVNDSNITQVIAPVSDVSQVSPKVSNEHFIIKYLKDAYKLLHSFYIYICKILHVFYMFICNECGYLYNFIHHLVIYHGV